MIYTPKVKEALRICFAAHKEQMDKGQVPYVFHPYHLAEQFEDEDHIVTSLLHDVVEDSDWTVEMLKHVGFNENVIEAVKLLTHSKEVPYEDYIKAIATNQLAKDIKIKDLEHNMDQSRYVSFNPSRYVKYKNAYEYLTKEC